MKRFTFFVGLLLWACPVFAADAPILIDVAIMDAMEGPYLEPLELSFQQGQEYLLVIRNDNGYEVNFHYDKFGQNIFTRLLQGSPNVSQESFGLPSNSKVLWLFSPSLPGEFNFHVSNAGMNQQGKSGKIIVNGLINSAKADVITIEKELEKPASEQKPLIKSFISHHKNK